jgi:hypothetical protein
MGDENAGRELTSAFMSGDIAHGIQKTDRENARESFNKSVEQRLGHLRGSVGYCGHLLPPPPLMLSACCYQWFKFQNLSKTIINYSKKRTSFVIIQISCCRRYTPQIKRFRPCQYSTESSKQ